MTATTPLEIITPPATLDEVWGITRFMANQYYDLLVDAGYPEDWAYRYTVSLNTDKEAGDYAEILSNSKRYYLRTLWQDDTRVGLFLGDLQPDHPGCEDGKYVEAIQLVPEVRGQGHGRQLMEDFMGLDERCTRLRALTRNRRTLHFYDSLGFVKTGSFESHIWLGQAVSRYVLEHRGTVKVLGETDEI